MEICCAETRLRIGLNLLYLRPGISGGTETYAKGLISGLSKQDSNYEYIVYVNRLAKEWPLPETGKFRRVVCPINGSQRWLRYLFEQVVLPFRAWFDKLDVLHSLGYVSSLVTHCPSVVTVHDLNYRAFGNLFSPARRWALSIFVRLSAYQCDHVIVPSEFSRIELGDEVPQSLKKTSVIWEASECRQEPAAKACEKLRGPYAMAFSGSSLHKNIPNLIQAFRNARLRARFPEVLLLVGTLPKGLEPTPEVVVLPKQPEDRIKSLMTGATFFVVPSIYEGFGLPVLEAMNSGVPVACSSAGSLPEVAGDGALLFDPRSIKDMEIAIIRMATETELRKSLIEAGKANAERFSWSRAAEETIKVYRQIAEPRS